MLLQLGDLIRRQHYAQAFAAIRLLAGLVAGLGLVAAMLIGRPPTAFRWFFAILAILTAVNVVTVWQSSRRRIDRWLVPLAVLDTILIGALIFITGGIASPLVLFLLLPIGQVAIGASPMTALAMSILCILAYTGVWFLPFGFSGLAAATGDGLAHLKVFNVIVSDVSFVAFALAAGQTGQALRSQEDRLLHRSSRLRREVGTLARLARATARETDLTSILGMALETACLELGVKRAAVLLSDDAAGDAASQPRDGASGARQDGASDGRFALHVVAVHGFGHSGADDGLAIAAPIAAGALPRAVVQHRRTLTAQERVRKRVGESARQEGVPTAAAAAPLLVGEVCLGCLYVDAGSANRPWTDEGLLLLEALADLTAVAVDNGRLYGEMVAEKSKLEATMGAVTDALLIYEPGGRVLLANAPFRSLFELSPQATGLTIDGLCAYLHEQQRLGLTQAPEAVRELFAPSAAELEIGLPQRSLQRRGKVVLDTTGQAMATVLTFHDVTEEHQAERVRAEILSTVSHELRTPLTSIKGFLQIFQRRINRGDAAASQHEVQLVLEQVEHLMALVDDLLDVSHLPGRHMRLVRGGVDLAELARERAAATAQETGRGIRLKIEAQHVLGVWDRKKVAQVIDNLLTNAVKYSEADSEVVVGITNAPGVVELAVRDQGVGVASEHQVSVFDAFFRVDNTTTRRTNGLGIGLYLCKRIIEEHGGEMYVRSQVGSGSEFGFSLPLGSPRETSAEGRPLFTQPPPTAGGE